MPCHRRRYDPRMRTDDAIDTDEPDELTPDEIAACEQSEADGGWYPLEAVLAELGL